MRVRRSSRVRGLRMQFFFQRPFERGAFLLAATSALSYALGLLRDRSLAATFGASDQLDAYQASFILPDFLFNLLVAAALSAAFIPVFTDLRTQRQNREAAELAGSLLVLGLGALLVVGVLLIIFAEPLTALVAPGFPDEKRALLANLTRILLLPQLFFLVSNLLGSMLVSAKRFLFYGLSPALYNLGIILGALLLGPAFGIFGVAAGTTIGAALHLAARIFDLRRARLSLVPNLRVSPYVRKVLLLMLPRMVGLTAAQAQLWVFTAIASRFGEGAVTVWNLARNFQSFPVSLVGIAFATSLFPLLAESASLRDRASYLRRLFHGSAVTLAVAVPAAVALYVLRSPIVALFVGTGAFDPQAVARTATVLGVYALAIPTESLAHVLARGFYALQNTLIPVSVSLVAIGVSVGASLFLASRIGLQSIPAGFAIGTGLQITLLACFLRAWMRRAL